ncbi:hypothetical protein [Clostridium sp. ZS2-4]|uniref:hypothetical protein n=1 Tax=Clostridium sp. ZS2-4 TaxID=2987703 RepID=UPI00227A6F0D|nr:hypothetical protein [Clostridium sp. ZS2-4]MCY6356531.1 hypothetical protein [Clostridium sp. ZS2-4]
MTLLEIIPEKFLTTAISAAAILTGTIIGSIWSGLIAKKNREVENKIVEDNKKCNNLEKINKMCENINIIRLDICNAIFQSIRTLKYYNEANNENKYPIPINKDYSRVVASITSRFDLKEMSYIYQLYAIIETLNKHMKNLNYNDDGYNLIKKDCELFLKKLYGKNFHKILQVDIETVSYEQLYNNEFIKLGYREVLKKLEKNSCVEGYEQ